MKNYKTVSEITRDEYYKSKHKEIVKKKSNLLQLLLDNLLLVIIIILLVLLLLCHFDPLKEWNPSGF